MFYAHFVLSKKGPLARIWLAAHWDKKLTKAHVFETNIENSVDDILQPKVKMALRTSGHLLLGVVRIYSRKAKYLLADCNEAFIKIKMAFRPGVVDLPEENREAALNAITLPEVFHDFDTAMPDLTEIDVQAQFTLNQSRAEEITMREDYGNVTLVGDDGFGDMGFEDNEIVREASSLNDSLNRASLLFGGSDSKKMKLDTIGSSGQSLDKDMDIDEPLRDDGFGGGVGEGLLSAETSGLFEPGGLFDDAPMEHVPVSDHASSKQQTTAAAAGVVKRSGAEQNRKSDDSDDDDYYGDMGPASMGCPSSGPPSPVAADGEAQVVAGNAANDAVEGQQTMPTSGSDQQQRPAAAALDQTTLVHNEDESFALAPLESGLMMIGGAEKLSKAKRKRKLIIDEVKNISGEEMKSQLADTTDIVTTLDLAPPTKRLMHWKETGGVEKLFALPGRPIHSRTLSKLYQRHLTTRAKENEDIGLSCNEDKMELEQPEDDEAVRMARKRKLSEPEVQEQPEVLQSPTIQQPEVQQVPEAAAAAVVAETMEPQPVVEAADQQQQQVLAITEQVPLSRTAESPVEQQQQQPLPLEPINSESSALQQQQQLSMVIEGEQFSPVHQALHQQQDNGQQQEQLLEQSSVVLQQTMPTVVEQPEVHHHQQQQQPTLVEDDFFAQPTATTRVNHVDVLRQQFVEDDDDMECPASVGPPEEQGADETYEQFEERVLNKRAQQMLNVIQRQFQRQSTIRFSDIARNNTRKQVAQKFYSFLVLKKQQAVELHQEAAFAELYITRGPKLDVLY